jgi:small-conductance mechanosensitive channel
MDATALLQGARDVLSEPLLTLGDRHITLTTVFTIVVVLVATLVLSRLARRAIRRAFHMRGVEDEGTIGVVSRLVHFVFLLVGFGVAVEAAGIDLSALFAAGAVFAVAIGFAVQNIMQNFVSGFILLAERAIKPGDVLEVDGQLVKVRRMGIRATVVRSLDDEDIIVPNSVVVQNAVTNFTLDDPVSRLRATVGVVYSSDMDLVMRTLQQAAEELPFRLKDRTPMVLLTDFGDNSVNFEISVWTNRPWESRRHRSELNLAIWNALARENIVIAFPQLDVHFDPPVAQGFGRINRVA